MPTLFPVRKALLSAALAMTAIGAAAAQAQEASTTGTQASSNQTVPDKAADAWITTKVKSELAATKGIHSTNIEVHTTDGVVTLSGTVGSNQERTKAEHVASKVKGVKKVDTSGLKVDTAAHSDSAH